MVIRDFVTGSPLEIILRVKDCGGVSAYARAWFAQIWASTQSRPPESRMTNSLIFYRTVAWSSKYTEIICNGLQQGCDTKTNVAI